MATITKKVPMNWRLAKLGDIAKITNGKTNSQDAIVDGEYPLFDRSVSVKKSNKFLFDGDAVILPGEGAEFVPRFYSGKFDLHQRAYAIFPNSAEVDGIFLYHCLYFNRDIFSQNAVGSTVKSLRLPIIQNVPILLPTLDEQKKIAAILSDVEEEIKDTNEIISATENLKIGLMQDLFTKGIGHTKFKKTKIGMLPEEWEIVSLFDLAKDLDNQRVPITKGDRKSGEYPYYGASGIIDYVEQYIFNESLLLISEDGANLKDRNYPIAFSVSGKSWVNNHAHVLKFNDINTQKFVEYYLNSIDMSPYLTGTAQPKLNKEKMAQIQIPKPPIKEIEQISNVIGSIENKIQQESLIGAGFIKLKQGLMQDLLSGNVRVT